MTYFETNGYDFELLDIDLYSYDDEYVENYLSNNEYDIILFGCTFHFIKMFIDANCFFY